MKLDFRVQSDGAKEGLDELGGLELGRSEPGPTAQGSIFEFAAAVENRQITLIASSGTH